MCSTSQQDFLDYTSFTIQMLTTAVFGDRNSRNIVELLAYEQRQSLDDWLGKNLKLGAALDSDGLDKYGSRFRKLIAEIALEMTMANRSESANLNLIDTLDAFRSAVKGKFRGGNSALFSRGVLTEAVLKDVLEFPTKSIQADFWLKNAFREYTQNALWLLAELLILRLRQERDSQKNVLLATQNLTHWTIQIAIHVDKMGKSQEAKKNEEEKN